ncbi:MAG: 2-succinyl-6-hydroxy-2,4-cyclohexadiene-1-carboxylate synthase [Ignavibacteria bacterium]|nr:2-succinyl-6-hydroxy-2,4-cyclohexadiene-1-carboxylate synthase [Ignavibacteria bacterium]
MVIQLAKSQQLHSEFYPSKSQIPLCDFILIHGFASSAKDFSQVAPLLAETGNVYAVDLPGFGKSIHPPENSYYSLNYINESILRLIRQEIRHPLVLLGYSMGGRVAAHFTLANPDVASLTVLESATPGIEALDEREIRVQSDELIIEILQKQGITNFVQFWESQQIFSTQSKLLDLIKDTVRLQRLECNPESLILALRNLGQGVLPSIWDDIHKISTPVLLITGELDTKYSKIASLMQQRMNLAQHVIVKSAGHNVHLEKPADFATFVNNFVKINSN